MTYIEVPLWLYTVLGAALGVFGVLVALDWIFIATLTKGRSNENKVLAILKKHAKTIAEFPGQEKEPDIQITVMPEADEDYETIRKWLGEE